jgi:hypothetical protein
MNYCSLMAGGLICKWVSEIPTALKYASNVPTLMRGYQTLGIRGDSDRVQLRTSFSSANSLQTMPVVRNPLCRLCLGLDTIEASQKCDRPWLEDLASKF